MIPFRDDVPAKQFPVITVLIILANLGAFLYQLTLPPPELERFIFQFGVVPAELLSVGQSLTAHPVSVPLSIVTSMFLHGGWLHLIGNMWYLWVFGDNVEDRMGHSRFLFFYLISGVVASSVHVFFNPDSLLPTIGASGAVAGVLGAYLLSYPFARILTIIPLFIFWPVVELPALLVLGFWFLLQLINGAVAAAVDTGEVGGVAWWAHIGGFVAGMILIGIFAKRPVQRYSWGGR